MRTTVKIDQHAILTDSPESLTAMKSAGSIATTAAVNIIVMILGGLVGSDLKI